LCREEAKELSSLVPKLNENKIKLVGVVHETLGVDLFRPYFPNGEIYYDPNRSFFKAIGDRWLGLVGFFYPSVWKNLNRSSSKGVTGNLEGEGRLLGGVLVIGSNDRGIVYEHREKVWGDHADFQEVLNVCERLGKSNDNSTPNDNNSQ